MSCKFFIYLLIIIIGALQRSECSKILAVFAHIGKSHFDVFEPYLEELAHRGHDVVVISHFPRKTPITNYRDIDLRGTLEINKTTDIVSYDDMAHFGQVQSAVTLAMWGVKGCDKTLGHEDVQKLIKSDEKFDLFITEMFNTDCYLSLAHRFEVPVIGFSSCVFMPWTPGRIGNPDNPAFIPTQFVSYSDRMVFSERFMNTFWYIFHKLHYPFLMDGPGHTVASKHLGQDLPSLSELARNTSLILVNNHFSLNRPRALVPGVVEVSGIHIRPAKKLPRDIEEFLNGAEHGVIYFSMGSMIRADTLPAEKRDAFLQAFSELPQRVIWKWESDTLPGKPKNVRTAQWLPQFDILNHPKVRVFLAHGGLLGTIEAVHVGVPMVGIPMYGDQNTNMRMVESAGMAVRLRYEDITKETILKALRTVLDNPSYAENAKIMSRRFRDRPMSPMDTAIYWTEYVIRHHGAPHMRTAGADLPLYQYLLLDVIAVLLATFLTIMYIIYLILRKLISFCSSSSSSKIEKGKKKQ